MADQVIAPESMDDAALEAALKTANDVKPDENPGEQKKVEGNDPQKKSEEKTDPKQPDGQQPKADEKSDDVDLSDLDDPNLTPEQLKQKVAEERKASKKANKQNEGTDAILRRRQSELDTLKAQLRKQIEEVNNRKAQEPDKKKSNEFDFDEPQKSVEEIAEAAVKKQEDEKQRQVELARLANQERTLDNEIIFQRLIPDYKDLVPTMAEIALEEKVPPDLVENFKANPYADDRAFLATLAGRARSRKAEVTVKALEAKVKDLEAKLSNRVDINDLSKKIDQAAQTPMSSKMGGSPKDPAFGSMSNAYEVAELSDEELNKRLAEANKK